MPENPAVNGPERSLPYKSATRQILFERSGLLKEPVAGLPLLAELQCWGAGVERAPVFRPEMNRTPPYAMNLNIL